MNAVCTLTSSTECKASLFSEYSVVSKNNNEISFNVNLDNLIRGLKSGQSAQEVYVKLTKKGDTAYLSLAIEMTVCSCFFLPNDNQPTRSMTVTQDIPVQIISPSQLAAFTEPTLPDPEVYIMMPGLKSLKSVIERMKNIDDYLVIHANMAGELTFKVFSKFYKTHLEQVQTEVVSIATFYKKLDHPHIEGRDPPKANPDQTAKVKVDIKKFARFMYSYQVQPQNVICCMFFAF